MINISLNEIITLVPLLKELINNSFDSSLSFKIGRLIRELDKGLELFVKSRNDIFNKYGLRDSQGNFITENNQIKTSEPEKCNSEIQKLLETKIEIYAEKIPISAFDNLKITPSQAITLDLIIE